MKLTRRSLIQKFGFLPAAMMLPHWLRAAHSEKKAERLIILHTNDTHSQIDPLPANHTKFPNKGGIAARAAMIEQFRKDNEQVLLLDAGDFFQGTPYFNRFHGVLEMKLMSQLGYDVVTLGNHDFDIGVQGFMNAQQHANFKFVNANYNFGKTPMAAVVQPFQIIRKGNFKVGIFGLGVDLNGLVPAGNFEGISMLDPYESAKKVIRELQTSQCNLIICLSHLGYQYEDQNKPSDVLLAEKVPGIDLILGGHTHTFMEEPKRVQSNQGKDVWIHQVGWAGVRLGVIEVDKNKLCIQQKTIGF
jgi:5'-nucleotidase